MNLESYYIVSHHDFTFSKKRQLHIWESKIIKNLVGWVILWHTFSNLIVIKYSYSAKHKSTKSL